MRSSIRSSSAPLTRRSFSSIWDEIAYLNFKACYWYYAGKPARARPFADRMGTLLRKAPDAHDAILGEECWSLIFELRGDLAKAIASRRRGISLIKRVHRIARRSSPKIRSLLVDPRGLAEQLTLLAMQYVDAGDAKQAFAAIDEARRLAKERRFRFEFADLHEDLRRAAGQLRKGATPLRRTQTGPISIT
jgi:hypothetical protein